MLKKILKAIVWIAALAALACVLVISYVQSRYTWRIHDDLNKAPKKPVALVLGASVKPDGSPSDALRDRVRTAVDLYHSGKVATLLMSGDDGAFHINEIESMRAEAIALGVPGEAIQTDGQGYRTYESCKRAVQEFGVRSALVITQRFHLSRALYLCRSLGMDAEGVVADRQPYIRIVYFWLRDLAASLKAFADIHISPAPPVVIHSEAG